MIREWRGGPLLPGAETEAAIRIRGQAAAYGAGCSFLPIWITEHGGALSLLDGAAVLAVGEEDWEECALFLSMRQDVRAVRTDARTARLSCWAAAGRRFANPGWLCGLNALSRSARAV